MFLFELRTRDSNSTVSYTNIDEDIVYHKAYSLKLTIYGNDCENVANNIVARFRSEIVRNSLLDNGVHIEDISDSILFPEFVNDSMWLRSDLSIDISCTFIVKQISKDDNFETLSELKVIKEENK